MMVMMLVDTLRTGGKEKQLYQLLRLLHSEHACEVHLVLMDQEVHFDGVSDLVTSMHYVLRTSKYDLTVIGRLGALVKALRPDIIHSWDPLTAALGAVVARRHDIPFINGMIRNVPHIIHDPFWPFLVAWMTIPLSDVYVANTHAGLSAYHIPRRKGRCIHNMYDFAVDMANERTTDLARDLELPAGRFVGMVGTFSRFKDYRTFFAMAELVARKEKDVTFLAVGDGPLFSAVRASISAELMPRVRFLGRRADVEHIISGLHVGVLTSRREGMSNVLMEYMASGVPIVTTAVGGTKELLPDERFARIVPFGDADAVAEAVLDILGDPPGAKTMASRAQHRLRTEFSRESFLSGYMTLYGSVVGRKGSK